MVAETRYFTSTARVGAPKVGNYDLATVNSGTAHADVVNTYDGTVTITQYYGIRIWIVHSDESETEVTSGTAVAIGSRSTTGAIDVNYTPPQTNMVDGDAIGIRVYADDFTPPTSLRCTSKGIPFCTDDLNTIILNAAQWGVHYHQTRTAAGGLTTYRFQHGSATYDSMITNFTYDVAPPAGGQQLFTLINQEDY